MPDTQDKPTDLRKSLLNVHIGSPDHVVYDGSAKAISTSNEKGPLDILPAHENFISIINDRIIIYDIANQPKEIKIDSAVMHVNKNRVDVFMGIQQIEIDEAKKKSANK